MYDFRYYDFYFGAGVERNRLQMIIKVNIIQAIEREAEWVELGIGFNF